MGYCDGGLGGIDSITWHCICFLYLIVSCPRVGITSKGGIQDGLFSLLVEFPLASGLDTDDAALKGRGVIKLKFRARSG